MHTHRLRNVLRPQAPVLLVKRRPCGTHKNSHRMGGPMEADGSSAALQRTAATRCCGKPPPPETMRWRIERLSGGHTIQMAVAPHRPTPPPHPAPGRGHTHQRHGPTSTPAPDRPSGPPHRSAGRPAPRRRCPAPGRPGPAPAALPTLPPPAAATAGRGAAGPPLRRGGGGGGDGGQGLPSAPTGSYWFNSGGGASQAAADWVLVTQKFTQPFSRITTKSSQVLLGGELICWGLNLKPSKQLPAIGHECS